MPKQNSMRKKSKGSGKTFIIHQNVGKGKSMSKGNHMGTPSKVNKNQPHGVIKPKKEE